MQIDKLATWVGLIGGGLGLITTIGGGGAIALAYFATRDQLTIVDCYQYHGQDSLSFQTEQMRLLSRYQDLQSKAVIAKAASQKAPQNNALQLASAEASRLQTEAYTELQTAQQRSKTSLEEQRKCGYKGPTQFSWSR